MSILRTLFSRLRALGRRPTLERDLDDELAAYVETLTARHLGRGLTPAAARRAALVEAGGVDQIKETVRDVSVGHTLATILRDVRYGGRILHRAPGYAVVVILTIALGIGINVTMFSVMHAVLWRALPYPDPARLVAIDLDVQRPSTSLTGPRESVDLRESRRLAGVGVANGVDASLAVDGVMERVSAASVTDDVLPLLGATPLFLGRTLVDRDDEGPGAVRAVVISYELWQRRFRSDPLVVGRHLEVNNIDVQVAGVTRPDLRVYLPPTDHVEDHVDIWFPTAFHVTPGFRGVTIVGRLAAGATIAQAQADLDALGAGYAQAHPDPASPLPPHFSIRPLTDVVTREARPALLALGAAVSLVLIIACINVANLMLARAKTRGRELALRRALGATRWRLVRQLLAETLVVSAIGGLAGWSLAHGGVAFVEWLRPSHLPRQLDIRIDGVVTLWAAAAALLSSVGFGLVPALSLTGDGIGHPLRAGRSGVMQRSRSLQRGLVIAEVALSIVPLVGAGLMLRTFVNLTDAPIGFEPAHVITAKMPLNFRALPEVDRRMALYQDAIARVRVMPGVDAVSAGAPLPFTPLQVTRGVWPADDATAVHRTATQEAILPGYFNAMGIPLRAGRDLTSDDFAGHRPVVLVDERLAAALWRGDAVGKTLDVEQVSEPLEVVGVVAPIRTSRVRDDATPTIFIPGRWYGIEQTLVVRTRTPLEAIGPAIKQAVESLGTGRPVFDIQPMTAIVSSSINEARFTMLVLVGFAGAALLLAAVGLYGTLAYLISQRTQEFGVRIALGASAMDVMRVVLREGGVLTAIGGALGLAGALGATRALRGLLYGVTPFDAGTLAGVVGLVAVVAMVAIGRPAWRASRVDPCTALRGD